MKVRFTGNAEASVTYMGKYEVETGSVLVVDDVDANALLQTGHFEAVDDEQKRSDSSSKSTDDSKTDDSKTDDSKSTDDSKDSKK